MLKGVVIDDAQLFNDKLAEWQDYRDAAYRRVWPDLTDEPQTNDQEGLITRR